VARVVVEAVEQQMQTLFEPEKLTVDEERVEKNCTGLPEPGPEGSWVEPKGPDVDFSSIFGILLLVPSSGSIGPSKDRAEIQVGAWKKDPAIDL